MGPSVLSGPRGYIGRAVEPPASCFYQRERFVCIVEGSELGETHRSVVSGRAEAAIGVQAWERRLAALHDSEMSLYPVAISRATKPSMLHAGTEKANRSSGVVQ